MVASGESLESHVKRFVGLSRVRWESGSRVGTECIEVGVDESGRGELDRSSLSPGKEEQDERISERCVRRGEPLKKGGGGPKGCPSAQKAL